mgnify:CR=1 FL=1
MIYALIILGITNVATLAAFAFYIYLESKEKAKTINALIAKNSQEYLNHEMTDKTEKIKVTPTTDLREDLTTLSDLTDEEFDKNIISQ